MRVVCRAGVVVAAAVAAGGCNLFFPLDGYQALDSGLVQQATAQGANTRSLDVMLPAAPIGDALILIVASSGTTPLSVAGGGVTWTEQSNSTNHVALAVWVGFRPTGPATPVTVSWAASPASPEITALVQLSEWVGPRATGDAEQNSGPSGDIATATLDVPEGVALVLAAAGTHITSVGAPANQFIPLDPVSASDRGLVAAYQLAPATGTYMTTWSLPTSDGWDTAIVSFAR